MANKQPIFEFANDQSVGVFNVPLGSLVLSKGTGYLFTLTTKTGLGGSSTLADAMAIPQNFRFRTDVTGATGPQGPDGPQGIQGPKGDIGSQGPDGGQGVQGDPGAGVQVYGSDTIVNIRGKANVDGHMWISTDAGVDDLGNAVVNGDGVVSAGPSWISVGPVRGPQGQQGPQGNAGTDGADGAQGIQGQPGPQGSIGITGDAGADGATGPIGAKGDTGDKGDQGDQGIQGIQGDQGIQGITGNTGADGAKGDDGVQGPKGDQGDIGPAGSDATVEFASQVEVREGLLPDKVVSPKTLNDYGMLLVGEPV